jgi:hypothetical protein
MLTFSAWNNSPPNTAPPECASAPTAQASLL